jgi:phosphoglucosamine mutase
MLQIGKAVGAYFTKPGDVVLVGWDPRESSEMLVKGVVDGLVAMGMDVRKVGVIPTPGLAYLTKQQKAKAGVMITASHNPYTDNGVKVFTSGGRKLPDDAQTALNDLIASDIAGLSEGKSSDASAAASVYEDFLMASAEGASLGSLNLGVDSANGATSGIAERVFTKLGAKVVPLFDKPDGRNINVQCGATDTAALQAEVQRQGLAAGVAFDGDGDRVILVDEKGRQLTGDHLLYILAVAGQQTGVVATLMSNQGLETALKKQGISLHRTAVGDRSVIEGLEQTGFLLGGEQSGHIILPKYFATGDGLLAAIRTLALVIASGKTLAAWYDELELLPQAIISLPFPDKSQLGSPDIKAFIADQTAQLGDAGRLNIRASGTEPKVRIMVEAPDADKRAQAIADQLSNLTTEKK